MRGASSPSRTFTRGDSAWVSIMRCESPPHEAQPDYALRGRINALQKLLDRQYVEKKEHFQRD